MLEQGWMREVRELLESGLDENAKPLDFIGYRELRSVLRGEMVLQQAREAIQQATRRYAKRQLTWFRKEAGVQWFRGFGHEPGLQADIFAFLNAQGLRKVAGSPGEAYNSVEGLNLPDMGKSAR